MEQERDCILEMIQSIQNSQEMRNICAGEAAYYSHNLHKSKSHPLLNACAFPSKSDVSVIQEERKTGFSASSRLTLGEFPSLVTALFKLLRYCITRQHRVNMVHLISFSAVTLSYNSHCNSDEHSLTPIHSCKYQL